MSDNDNITSPDRFKVEARAKPRTKNKWPWKNMAVGDVISYTGTREEMRTAQKAATAMNAGKRKFFTWKDAGVLYVKRVTPELFAASNSPLPDYPLDQPAAPFIDHDDDECPI